MQIEARIPCNPNPSAKKVWRVPTWPLRPASIGLAVARKKNIDAPACWHTTATVRTEPQAAAPRPLRARSMHHHKGRLTAAHPTGVRAAGEGPVAARSLLRRANQTAASQELEKERRQSHGPSRDQATQVAGPTAARPRSRAPATAAGGGTARSSEKEGGNENWS